MEINELRACIKDMFSNMTILLCRNCGHEWQDVGEQCLEELKCNWCGSDWVEKLNDE